MPTKGSMKSHPQKGEGLEDDKRGHLSQLQLESESDSFKDTMSIYCRLFPYGAENLGAPSCCLQLHNLILAKLSH